MAFVHPGGADRVRQRTDADEAERGEGLLKCGEWAYRKWEDALDRGKEPKARGARRPLLLL